MTPAPATPTPTPTVITVGHPSTLTAADVLATISQVVQTDAPIIVQAFPSPTVDVGFAIGELGLLVSQQIATLLHNLHLAKSTPTAQ